MTDDELNQALADELSAIRTASEENIVQVPEAPEETIQSSSSIMTIELPESASAIDTVDDGQELVLQEVEAEVVQTDTEDFDIVVEPTSKVGFVKRWTRKIVGWVKRVFSWRRN